jgi:hypothetical protein
MDLWELLALSSDCFASRRQIYEILLDPAAATFPSVPSAQIAITTAPADS